MVNSETETKPQPSVVDFSNTKIAFAHKDDGELKKTAWLFRFMNKSWLVKATSSIGLWLNETGIHIFNPLVRETFFWQFCGGRNLQECADVIEHLRKNNTYTVLDYGVEGKTREKEFDQTVEEIRRAIKFASAQPGVPVISMKLTSLVPNDLLEKYQSGSELSSQEREAFDRFHLRVETLCKAASDNDIAVFIDAEETWLQDPIDELTIRMMEKFNREKVVVYQTYQMYRKGKLDVLKADHQEAKKKGYRLGAKIVRGAYLEKERKRAQDMGYPSPVHDSKEDTDNEFNAALLYLIENYAEIASCNATHNLKSNRILAEFIASRDIPRDHPNLFFCQLFGMSDNITFNLASAGFNVAKILPYGPVKEVIPYLIRRAKENTSVTGDMSRELALIMSEMKRRGLK